MDCGRFLRSDNYTVARDRLDYARVLISTTALAVVKKVEQLLVDGTLVEIQIIEEWGFDLGNDACLLEDDAASKVSLDADDASRGDPEASYQVDMLVDHIAQEVADANCTVSQQQGNAMQSVNTHRAPHVKRAGSQDQGICNPVIEPVVVRSISSGGSVECGAETVMTTQKQNVPVFHNTSKILEVPGSSLIPSTAPKSGQCSEQRKRTLSCPPASRSRLSGPWSLEWLRDHNLGGAGIIFSARKRPKQGGGADKVQHKRTPGGPTKKKMGGFLSHSIYSLKRIARLPVNDRREVLHILQKNARRRRPKGVAKRPNMSVSRASAEGASSSSSVNNDWKH
jgi:hypothetical protein